MTLTWATGIFSFFSHNSFITEWIKLLHIWHKTSLFPINIYVDTSCYYDVVSALHTVGFYYGGGGGGPGSKDYYTDHGEICWG